MLKIDHWASISNKKVKEEFANGAEFALWIKIEIHAMKLSVSLALFHLFIRGLSELATKQKDGTDGLIKLYILQVLLA